jgi:hypothetical protein
MSIGEACSLLDFFKSGRGISVLNVGSDCSCKKSGFLTDISNGRPQVRNVDVLQVHSIKFDTARLRIIESFQHRNHRAFPATTVN